MMNSKRKKNIFFLTIFFLLVFLFALTAFYPAESSFFPTTVPDSTENALAAYHIAKSGKCGFFLNGSWYPSRYSFILPATFFAPWVWLFSGEMMAGIYGCFSAALLLLFSLAGMGKILKSSPGVLLALPFLLFLPELITLCNNAMTEIPYTALLALALFLLVKTASKENFSRHRKSQKARRENRREQDTSNDSRFFLYCRKSCNCSTKFRRESEKRELPESPSIKFFFSTLLHGKKSAMQREKA